MFKTTHMQFHLQPKTSGNGHSSSTPSKIGATYHQILQLPSQLSRSYGPVAILLSTNNTGDVLHIDKVLLNVVFMSLRFGSHTFYLGNYLFFFFFFFFFRILPTFNILNILAGVRKVKNWIKTYVQCLFVNTVKDWSNLPPDIAAAKSIESFKAQVAKLFE
jgi:hypothetical protein